MMSDEVSRPGPSESGRPGRQRPAASPAEPAAAHEDLRAAADAERAADVGRDAADDEERAAADDEVPDPAEMLRMIAEQRETTRRQTEPNGLVLFGAWGIAWLAGYLVLHATFDPALGRSSATGFIVFGLCLVAAMVTTAVHIGRRSVGVRGESAVTGAMYGWAWVVSFVLATLLFAGLGRAGANPEVMAVATNGVSCVVIAALYMAGGALWREPRMFALGVWIAVVGGVASLVPSPGLYLVMALAGGGGFLAAALADRLRAGARGRS